LKKANDFNNQILPYELAIDKLKEIETIKSPIEKAKLLIEVCEKINFCIEEFY
jgi:hypothetical protein